MDAAFELILWATSPTDMVTLAAELKSDKEFLFDYLVDLTAYDNIDGVDGSERFVLVYQLYSQSTHMRVRLKLLVGLDTQVKSLVSLFLGANWLEREAFDMYGIVFEGHPNLRRIMMDDRFVGYPLRKEYPMKQRQPFSDNIKFHLGQTPLPLSNEESGENRVNLNDFYNPNVLLNLGPSHPAMHGTLRVMCRINGETIEDAACELGYLHRAIEKLGENRSYHQWIVYTDRLNYCSSLANNVGYCMAVEKLMGLTITDRTMVIRVMAMELSRIIDHLVCVAINALDLGAMTIFWHFYYWREEAYTMIESMCGMRLTTSYARIGGMSYDLPENFEARMRRFVEEFPRTLNEVSNLLTSNRIWIDRTRGVGIISKEDAIKYSLMGPVARASGVDFDLRRDRPYYNYPNLDFDVAVGTNGDVYDRYLVRMEEMRQSVRILQQCVAKIPKGPIWVDDKRVKIPAKQDVYTKMEDLIHHFKIFMEGIEIPPGEAYSSIEAPNGELGFYIVARGGPKAWRMRVKSPSFMLFQNFEQTVKGGKIPDAVATLGSINIIAGELDR
ncbi:MAG: NADH dehydrogenase (quinone) subunit D [Bdellovibrionales bacterium RIFOXYD12_FULL_39_22]|nr:MAG: NADH dehydrogenase (quinone) subunit D [Bdellovibrionales bacterium RIFOXYB1_FULL_39_21]OFZ44290.1 MAG: NADH dehydrogenase (quinone) subunit D [Bdellovibrionales bacterium RIFOXYC12_FULL_39_17]OFZ46838.1 MAG: NADH dehydrogenase (quinone) subunit D [Bdellovibrionales bacterium RIFOXYC1_FULL_39_130]OFZ76086.1 MAG: NADH dehydrogenase (quinone) subunit D [Bdellovibrionales bacterium RIFOXYD1_FULL_39_84]OFZ95512.1 MAG: NADH dehydrogenase (quinone) subunit D [Bdellovibrionales bacterium RIFOX